MEYIIIGIVIFFLISSIANAARKKQTNRDRNEERERPRPVFNGSEEIKRAFEAMQDEPDDGVYIEETDTGSAKDALPPFYRPVPDEAMHKTYSPEGFSSREGARTISGYVSKEGFQTQGFGSNEGRRTEGFGSNEGRRTEGFGSREGVQTEGIPGKEGTAFTAYSSRYANDVKKAAASSASVLQRIKPAADPLPLGLFDTKDELLKAVIYSEVLKRPGERRRYR